MDRLSPVAFAAPITFAPAVSDDASGRRRFSSVAYGGGVITDHPLYERIAFDCASTILKTPAPVLYGHGINHEDPIGVIDSQEIDSQIRIAGHLLCGLDEQSKKVAAMSDAGLPWQTSVRIYPGKVDEIKRGDTVELNGQTMAGPLTVFRNNRVREVSFCALGADDQTSAQVFTIGATQAAAATPESQNMSDTIAKEEHDLVVAKLAAADESLKAANAQIAELQGKFAAQALEHRTAAVKELFTACGREYKEPEAAPYLSMDDVTFAAVSKDLRAARPALDPNLMRTQADNGMPGDDSAKPKTAAQIIDAARAYVAAQAKVGVTVSNTEAVQFVCKAA